MMRALVILFDMPTSVIQNPQPPQLQSQLSLMVPHIHIPNSEWNLLFGLHVATVPLLLLKMRNLLTFLGIWIIRLKFRHVGLSPVMSRRFFASVELILPQSYRYPHPWIIISVTKFVDRTNKIGLQGEIPYLSRRLDSSTGTCIYWRDVALGSQWTHAVADTRFHQVWMMLYIMCLDCWLIFGRASNAHTGSYLASRVAECLREYGIHDKVSRYRTTMPYLWLYHVRYLL